LSRRGRRVRHRRRNLLALAVLGLLVLPFLLTAAWLWYEVDPPGDPGRAVRVEVKRGWGVHEIGDALQGRGVVGSSLAFQLYARLSGKGPFQAGAYDLRERMGASAAADALARASKQDYRKLALPPGLTLETIATRVGKVPGLSATKFLAVARANVVRSRYEPPTVTSLEGLTAPDTYYVSKGEDETALLRILVKTFDARGAKAGLDASPDPYRAITIASLIQTEAKLDEDRPLIAAVVENRLRDAMPLQIDATVLYARGSRRGPLTDADFHHDSPYNTYLVKGLPPTPISTVSTASLTAAAHPASVPYKFYVLIDANGKHAFATTYAEHQRNVAEARKKGLLG